MQSCGASAEPLMGGVPYSETLCKFTLNYAFMTLYWVTPATFCRKTSDLLHQIGAIMWATELNGNAPWHTPFMCPANCKHTTSLNSTQWDTM